MPGEIRVTRWEFSQIPWETGPTAATQMLWELSEPKPPGEKVKATIRRVAKLAGLGYWRAFDIWYRKARRIEVGEANKIWGALRDKNERAAGIELEQLKLQIAVLEARLPKRNTNRSRPASNLDR